ncbi:helix-turn-helix transcriptional regulator [Curtobacterium sp. MCJR17_055]|uniref:helix-turn-helix transcriptional regulator n=1 Tax=unclassified Curtobacterium TaxID=257496 RepID=UPI000D8A90A5|nr:MULTISPECIES: LuxR family transcriptional regulator [unclassified Curtobacterium]PYY34071.1 helix-turn-helix transcriptional regulator [Curtobacterium sp. MCBD17_029]PYY53921.1 helix-turn-helix transcriptional regulator [Curtobacterium sp. MCJR17_055]PYY59192.1 helix-turn-helix transcriptional regulator [Curtobacterium sp. MCPF17_015]
MGADGLAASLQGGTDDGVLRLRTDDQRPLLGRDEELAALTALLDRSGGGGTAVLVEGEAGVGKTALVAAVEAHARHAGHRVLRCTGVQGSNAVGFDGLHELLHPLIPYADALPGRQRAALLTALAVEDGPVPDRLLVSTAALGLLEEAAAHRPVLVRVEDLHWVDRSSAEVLDFIGLRLSNAPIVVIATARTGHEPTGTLPCSAARLELGPLPEDAAEALLAERAGGLSETARRRILAEAGGNPLALRELPAALAATGAAGTSLATRLPTTRRLEQAFLDQLSAVPAGSRALLVLAAAADDAVLQDVMAAARTMDLGLADLGPLEVRGLLRTDLAALHFRHPLLRSAVLGSATAAELAAAHRALASVARDETRAAWHRASATFERDETIAADLETVARRAEQRGARPEAVRAYERAATLSQGDVGRARRLGRAAETARAAGMTNEAIELLEQVDALAGDPDTVTATAVTRTVLSLTTGSPVAGRIETDRVRSVLGGAEHTDRLVEVLWVWALSVRGRNLPRAEWHAIETQLRSLSSSSPLKPVALALLNPFGTAPAARADLPHLVPQLTDSPLGMASLAIAAESLQDLETALTCWELAYERAHELGAVADEAQALRGRATVLLLRGRIRDAVADAEYAVRMASESHLPLVAGMAYGTLARAHALLGDAEAAAQALRDGSARSLGGRLALASADARWAAGLVALGQHRYRDAQIEFTHMTVHPTRSLWAIADRTEAAVHGGRPESVTETLAQAEAVASTFRSAHLTALVLRSRALLAPADRAESWFVRAVEAGQLSESPVELARTRLLFGEWLRRERRVVEARTHLREALAEFVAAGTAGFAARAAAELRAAGEAPPNGTSGAPSASAPLTPQELQIARLAAAGMSNREIADRIYLSHRTVSTHLYKVFPKLGVSSRAGLAEALAATGHAD